MTLDHLFQQRRGISSIVHSKLVSKWDTQGVFPLHLNPVVVQICAFRCSDEQLAAPSCINEITVRMCKTSSNSPPRKTHKVLITDCSPALEIFWLAEPIITTTDSLRLETLRRSPITGYITQDVMRPMVCLADKVPSHNP